jgi:MFS family permease
MAAFPCFWTLLPAFISGAAVAGGIGVVNSIGNLSGFLGPYWVGWMTDLFGSAKWGLVTIGLVMIAGAVLSGLLGNPMAAPNPKAASESVH